MPAVPGDEDIAECRLGSLELGSCLFYETGGCAPHASGILDDLLVRAGDPHLEVTCHILGASRPLDGTLGLEQDLQGLVIAQLRGGLTLLGG